MEHRRPTLGTSMLEQLSKRFKQNWVSEIIIIGKNESKFPYFSEIFSFMSAHNKEMYFNLDVYLLKFTVASLIWN